MLLWYRNARFQNPPTKRVGESKLICSGQQKVRRGSRQGGTGRWCGCSQGATYLPVLQTILRPRSMGDLQQGGRGKTEGSR